MRYGLSGDHVNTRPADVLVQGWDRGKPAAFEITVTSPLTPTTLRDASSGGEGGGVENTPPMLPRETLGHWGKEAPNVFSHLTSLLVIHQGCPKSVALFDIYSRMNMCLAG